MNEGLFGGNGYDIAGSLDLLNDLWQFDGTNWTWIAGNDVINSLGIFGTLGSPDASNIPGAREGSVSWTDSVGDVWLFGGYGHNGALSVFYLNDLWRYGP